MGKDGMEKDITKYIKLEKERNIILLVN